MSFAPLIPIAGCVLNAFFGFFVFLRNTKAPANRIYLVIGLFIAAWNTASFHLLTTDTPESATFWARFLHAALLIGIVSFFHLMLHIARFSAGRWMVALYVFSGICSAFAAFTPWFISGARYRGFAGWYGIAGPLYFTFPLILTLMFAGTIVLLRRRRTLPPLQGRRLTPLICAQFVLTLFGTNDILPLLGFDNYPFTNIQVFPYGNLAAVFYGIVAAYAVLQNELLDVKAGLGRAAAHLVRFIFLVSIAGSLLLAIALLTNAFTPVSFGLALLVFVFSSLIAAVLFPRLFSTQGIEKFERRILGDHFEYQDRVRAFIQALPWQHDLDELLDELHGLLTRTLNLRGYDLILRDEAAHAFTRSRSHPERPREQIPELKIPSPVTEYFERYHAEYLTLTPDYEQGTSKRIERLTREQLASFDAAFCLPLTSEKQLVGLLFVGPKANDEPYTSTDLQLLTNLAKNLSLIVNQIRLKEEVLRAQEFDLLGRMSRGMAHDLNNLLTPVSTLIQLAIEGHTEAALDDDLISVAERNLRTFRSYIKEALFFSENLRPDLQIGRLDTIVQHACDVARATRKKAVTIVAQTPGEISAEIDEVLIQRLLSNVISNAIDASASGAEIRIVLERLAKTEAARDWFRLRVIDQGEGIPKENLDRVLRPYFTTKDRGDEGRGFGLGLAISRRIVALHGGQLTITSQLRRGTVVQIDLPSRQLRPEMPALDKTPTHVAA